jgi:hypothetical protein
MLNLRQIRTSKNDNLCGGNWIAAMPIQCRKGFRIVPEYLPPFLKRKPLFGHPGSRFSKTLIL